MTIMDSAAHLTIKDSKGKNPMTSQKRRVVFAGTPEFAATSLEALIHQQQALNIEIVAVYTQPDRKSGRGQKLSASVVKQVALAHDIPVEQPSTFRKSNVEGMTAREILSAYQPHIMIVAAYGLILPVGVLTTPTFGCLNIHASLLPRWRGAAPIHRALLAGDTETGITIMQMDKGLDTGDMLYKISCDIDADESASSLHDKLANLGAEAIVTVLQDLSNYQTHAIEQDDSQANYAKKLVKSEGEIDWTRTNTYIERQIRGLTPWPGAYTFLEGTRVKILASLPINNTQTTSEIAGKIVSVGRKAILVACGKDKEPISSSSTHAGTLLVTQLQFAGSKPMSAEQICHGNHLNDGDQFTTDPDV